MISTRRGPLFPMMDASLLWYTSTRSTLGGWRRDVLHFHLIKWKANRNLWCQWDCPALGRKDVGRRGTGASSGQTWNLRCLFFSRWHQGSCRIIRRDLTKCSTRIMARRSGSLCKRPLLPSYTWASNRMGGPSCRHT
jgi:hypothetical protein